MDQVLYVKYNSMRRPVYRLTTEIHEGDEGKWVVKKAGDPAALPHMERVAANRALAEKAYGNIAAADVKKEKDRLVFPFVSGTPLINKIDTDRLDKERFTEQVNSLFDLVLAVKDECRSPFKATEAFVSIFGDQYIEDVPAICPANIDSIFSNFIETENGLVCLDYEWVYDFPVPVDFIRYRVLFHLFNEWEHSLFDGISREAFMEWFGLDEEKQAIYWNMESRFQQEIHGEEWRYFYTEKYKKRRLQVQELDDEIKRQKGVIQDKDAHIANVERIVQNKEQVIHDKDIHIANIEEAAREKDVHVANLEQILQNKEQIIHDRDVYISNIEEAAREKDVHIANLEQINRDKDAYLAYMEKAIYDKDVHITNLEQQITDLTHSFFWRATKPFRATVNGTRRLLQKNGTVYLSARCLKSGLRHGPKSMKKVWDEGHRELEIKENPPGWTTEEERLEQSQEKFNREIKFSILVPLYNTPREYLVAMIRSVQDQTYGNWELCLADGSDDAHKYVKRICKRLARKDKRIRYRKLKENLGISGNTNECIEMATGDYIALFDHDDVLHPSALYEDMKAICEKDADFIYTDENTFHDIPADAYQPHYKPDFAPDTLRANNYICHFTVFEKELLEKAGGGFRSEFDGSQDFDLVLRLTEKAKKIVHIPKVLYYWRAHKNSVAESVTAKPYVIEAAKKAIGEHLKRVGLEGEALDSVVPSMYRLKYTIKGEPLISIIIPNMDHREDLKRCIDSILQQTTYPNWEIIIVENNSTEEETFQYYEELKKDSRIRIVEWKGKFNYSAINNFGFKETRGEHILLLNNDVEVISPDWLQEMLMYSQREDVGAVGAKLYYPDHTIQHAGLGLGILTLAGHYHRHFNGNHPGYMGRLIYAQDLTGVTAACMMMPRHVYEEMEGLDETFEVAFNDVDLCMRIRKAGYLILWTPFAELYHYESKSRGLDDAPEKRERFVSEVTRFQKRWEKELAAGDPYYNPNLTLDREDFGPAGT